MPIISNQGDFAANDSHILLKITRIWLLERSISFICFPTCWRHHHCTFETTTIFLGELFCRLRSLKQNLFYKLLWCIIIEHASLFYLSGHRVCAFSNNGDYLLTNQRVVGRLLRQTTENREKNLQYYCSHHTQTFMDGCITSRQDLAGCDGPAELLQKSSLWSSFGQWKKKRHSQLQLRSGVWRKKKDVCVSEINTLLFTSWLSVCSLRRITQFKALNSVY